MSSEPEKRPKAPSKFVLSMSIRQIKHQPLWFILTTLSSFIFFFTPLILALASREIFDQLLDVGRYSFTISTLIWIIPVAYAIQLTTEITFILFVYQFILRNQILLRKNMLKGVFAQPGADSLEKSPGEAISRFRGDIESIIWFTSLIGDITAFLLFAVAAFYLMFNINLRLTLVTFFPFILVVTIINLSKRKIMKFNDASRTAAGKVTGAVGESFGAIQAIKVASAERHVFNHFNELNNIRRKAAVKDSSLQAALRSFGQVIVAISTGVILFLVGSEMKAGNFTIGDFTLFIFLLNWLTGFIRFLGEFTAWFQRNRVSYGRVLKIMQGNSNPKYPENKQLMKLENLHLKHDYPLIGALERINSFEELEVNNLSYTYRGTSMGINNINLSFKKCSFNVIVGRVGAGKSTLLKSILGLLPAHGDIRWNGNKIIPSEFMQPPQIAYTSQVPSLFSDTIEKNIKMGLPVESVDMHQAVKFAEVDEEIEQFEEGFQTMVGPKGVRLSGGQRHRLAAARMFARQPEVLIFDDLSSALDVKTEEKLWKGLFNNSNSTYLVTSHRKFVLQCADCIFVMKNGEIIDRGKLNDLLARSEEMRNLWGMGEKAPKISDFRSN